VFACDLRQAVEEASDSQRRTTDSSVIKEPGVEFQRVGVNRLENDHQGKREEQRSKRVALVNARAARKEDVCDWLTPADWEVLIRRRLVLPIADTPTRCGNCGTATADIYGDHSVVCMHGPARYKIHNTIRDTTVRICQEALLSPIVEPELPGGGRGDVLLRFPGAAGNRSLVVVDFAMTTIATRPQAALASPGGAATRYEQNKRDKYQARADEMGAQLVPVIVDDAGAWGDSALPFWKRIIRRFAQRFDLALSKATVVVMGAVSSAMMSSVAQAIRCSAIPRPRYMS
jgi:hypothetical protein